MSIADQRLRLELLRASSALERAELAGAIDEVREKTVPLLGLAGAVTRVSSLVRSASRLSSRGGWVALALAALDQKPWVSLLLAGGLRLARRRPLTATTALGAVVVAAAVHRAHSDAATATANNAAGATNPVNAAGDASYETG